MPQKQNKRKTKRDSNSPRKNGYQKAAATGEKTDFEEAYKNFQKAFALLFFITAALILLLLADTGVLISKRSVPQFGNPAYNSNPETVLNNIMFTNHKTGLSFYYPESAAVYTENDRFSEESDYKYFISLRKSGREYGLESDQLEIGIWKRSRRAYLEAALRGINPLPSRREISKNFQIEVRWAVYLYGTPGEGTIIAMREIEGGRNLVIKSPIEMMTIFAPIIKSIKI